ncbi:PREDICTED: X-linked retinitis pigmentosa GTPase regulator-interacting protein 1 [Nanorana parkeri]|uniref:X-linked retinitis pigmentosa GTPase regulator-interacting protein 1 n=1 Tax=Nanorana parkeri TaxID=125878 RepID=UPI000854163C|nr:PREDICTED: X-linked retinitis pigmentosa GTPase regulator-interacting protein 1 [Nanorana parkeri]
MSLMDETASDLPVKDTDCRPTVLKAIQEKDLKTRRRAALISRDELEDSFLRLHEENLLLKEYARKQEDKIKRMATKLLRLTSDLGQHGEKKVRKEGRDIEAEDTMENLQDHVRDLERRNEALRQRLTTYKQRLQLQDGCRHCPYGAISAQINSGIRKTTTLPEKYKKGLRVQGPGTGPPRVTADCCGESLSDEARAEIERLFQIISRQNCNMDEKATVILKHIAAAKPKDLETEIMLSLQHVQQAEDQRTIIQENIMNIRLQKELREKNTSLCALREQFQQLKESYETELQEKQKSLTLSHKAVLMQLEDLSIQLKEERSKVVALEVDQQNMATLQRSLVEYQERVIELDREKDLLKEHYENLLKSSLNLERVNSWKMAEAELKAQITKLEEQIQCYESGLTHSKEQLQLARDQSEQLKQDVSRLQCQLLEKMQEIHDLQDKISVLSSSSTREASCEQDMTLQKPQTHIPEDYWILKKMFREKEDFWNTHREGKRQAEADERSQVQAETEETGRCRDFRMEVEEEERRKPEQETKRKLLEMDAAHAETILELEKVQEMLILQHQINKDYQEELKSVKLRAESESREREELEHHYEAKLLKRSSRIQNLEAQLKDIAYGTIPYRHKDEESPSPEVSPSPPPTLQRGETLFEIHIGGICFSAHGIRVVDDPQPITFCIYSLYDFETHATPVVTEIRPQYNFTSCYAVTPDPEFLCYLRLGTVTVELNQVIGGEHRELARGRLRLDTVLQSTDRVHGTVMMTDATGENIGELDYWLRQHGPLSRTQCLKRQKSKAKVYLSTRRITGLGKAWAPQVNNGNHNALIIRIWGCRSLKTSTLGHQPSPYIVYRFYHHPDHSSSIIPCSNNPQFGDEAIYPVHLTNDLERYLKKECLYIYVFDDEETQPGSYLGKAEVPLQSLTQGSSIQGDFALISPCSKCSGSVQLSLEWKFPYHAPGKSLWDSVTSGQVIRRKLQEVPFSEQNSHGKQLPKEDQSRTRPTKSRKAEEDLHGDVSSRKRGRRDGHITDVHQKGIIQDFHVSEHHSDEMDVTVQDIAVEQEESQGQIDQLIYEDVNESDHETTSVHSDKFLKENDENNISEHHSGNDDDDMIIVAKPLASYKSPSSRIRVEIVSLTLDPCSEVVADESVERVFVEFQFAGVPAEETETPLSLCKPCQGEEIYYHFSKVIHLDGKEHVHRRHFLYMLLEGSDTEGERIRLTFTVASDPINEEDDECRDVGYAYLDLRHLLRRSVDPAEETLQIQDASNPGQTIGSLHVIIEAREAARAVYREKRIIRSSSPSILIH